MTRPEGDMAATCIGTNCGITRYDQEHSPECVAEHAASAAPAAQGEAAAWRRKYNGTVMGVSVERTHPDLPGWTEEPLYAAAQREALTVPHVMALIEKLCDEWSHGDASRVGQATEAVEEALYALASQGEAPPPSVPAGWKLVPVEPTEAMLDVMHDRIRILVQPERRSSADIQNDRDVWAAMLAAAPPPEQAAQPAVPLTDERIYEISELYKWHDGDAVCYDIRGFAHALLLEALATPPAQVEQADAARLAVEWAVGRWRAEVANRPLVNVHRRSLDDTWRQVIRHFGGDPTALIGSDHDALLAARKEAP